MIADTLYVSGCGHITAGTLLPLEICVAYYSPSKCCRCGVRLMWCGKQRPDGWMCYSHKDGV